jgi:protein-tyrosine-phosphatase
MHSVPRLKPVTAGAEDATVKLLFVCTGNICRSAAADRILATWAARRHQPLSVRSAGTRARPGRPIHAHTEQALERHGVRSDGFVSRRLREEDVQWADVVLTMTAQHREAVLGLTPRAMHKVFTLLEAATLSQTLEPHMSHRAGPGVSGPRISDALRDARFTYARAHGPAFDIVDPIDGPANLHGEVVDQIAGAIEAIVRVLDHPAPTEQTVRMPRLPPVPRPA